jgi:hypothetical protein
MFGAGISRWTMSYFATALAWLVLALALMVAGIGYPAADLQSPDTLVLVHVVCIGWLSVAMCGALFQFVPVLVAKPLVFENWALPALGFLTAGLACLLAGFLVLGGRLPAWPWLLPLGALLLAAGFGLIALDLGLTASLRPAGSARFVLVGLVSLCATVAFGGIFAFVLAGRAGPAAGLLLEGGVSLHAIAGIGGWLTLTAMGVSYRLLSMFMLAPEVDDRKSGMTLAAGALAIAAALIGGVIAIGLSAGLNAVLTMAAVMGMAGAALYGRDIAAIYHGRERRRLELNMRMATLSFMSLAATVLLGAVLVAAQIFTAHLGAFVFLAVFGWLSGLILAKLYKIVAFLTWLETYGPVMGRTPTPRVQDLVAESRAMKWFVIYYVSVWAGTIALLICYGALFRIAAAAMTLGVIGVVREVIRTRRLADVASGRRLPGGAVAPHLLFARN